MFIPIVSIIFHYWHLIGNWKHYHLLALDMRSPKDFSSCNRKKLIKNIYWANEQVKFYVLWIYVTMYSAYMAFFSFSAEFGSFEWSPDATKLLYVAEKKLPKTEPFYKQKPLDKKEKKEEDEVSRVIHGVYGYLWDLRGEKRWIMHWYIFYSTKLIIDRAMSTYSSHIGANSWSANIVQWLLF